MAKKRVRTSKKNSVEVRIIKKAYGKAPEEYAFMLADGRKLRSLTELIHSLKDMSDEVFTHHVNDFKNDFATWVHDIFEDKELSAELRSIRDRLKTQEHLLKKLAKVK
ncbi:MAG: DUF5752 family protein [Candidatus Woesearchaeota archaeon]